MQVNMHSYKCMGTHTSTHTGMCTLTYYTHGGTSFEDITVFYFSKLRKLWYLMVEETIQYNRRNTKHKQDNDPPVHNRLLEHIVLEVKVTATPAPREWEGRD